MNRATKITGVLVLLTVTGLLTAAAFLNNRASGVAIAGLVLTIGLQSAAAFWGLGWALPRSNRAFFSIFVGDALIKMGGLALAVYWLWARHLPCTVPLLTLGGSHLLLSFVQIPFFCRVR